MLVKQAVLMLLLPATVGQLLLPTWLDEKAEPSSQRLERLRVATRERFTEPQIKNPQLCDKVQQHAGYIPLSNNTEYFFWMFESRRDPSTDPLILWLSGGPGCSSLLALLYENGPCSVQDDLTTKSNPFSWTNQANVIWVDQPTNTGFSWDFESHYDGPYVHDEAGVASNMYIFLQKFYEVLPQYKSNPFYIFGESYAGHFVPALSHYIWEQGQNTSFEIPLKGIGIGNGLTNPEVQYAWYPEQARDGGRSYGGTLEEGVLTEDWVFQQMKDAAALCVAGIRECNKLPSPDNEDVCLSAFSTCVEGLQVPYTETGYSPYDMRKLCVNDTWGQPGNLCHDYSTLKHYLQLEDVQEALGLDGLDWFVCNLGVSEAFSFADWLRNSGKELPDLLHAGIEVLIYAGDTDYVCHWLGNKMWTLELEWAHKSAFNSAKDLPYMVNGTAQGRLRSAHGFHFLQVFQAGHMVPLDQPLAALQMVNDFTGGTLGVKQAEDLVFP